MPLVSSNPSLAAGLPARRDHPFARLARTIVASVRRWRERRAILAEFNGLDRSTLADLRIDRGDFHAIAEGTFERYDTTRPGKAPAQRPR
jgi:uncharacterized protein YjiS (DUF1127 family)